MEFIGPTLVAAVAAGLAYWLGLRKARIESRSARQLAWLESALAQLLAAAGELNNARAADHAGMVGKERDEMWGKALLSLGELRHLELEAEAYVPNSTAEAISEAVGDIIHLSTMAGRLGTAARGSDPDRLFEMVRRLIYHAASRIAGEVREAMGLDQLRREWRLYDAEIRQLRDDIQESPMLSHPPATEGDQEGSSEPG